MNILFLTLLDFESLEEHNIYTDLLREFAEHGHKIFVISPTERKMRQNTHFITDKDVSILKLKIGNTQKTNVIEKGISTLLIGLIFTWGIRKYFSDIRFDLVLYSTPPVTIQSAVGYVKEKNHASTYLLLKDVFPQNSVDIGLMSKKGLKALLYRYFRSREKKLYALSDHIGCMSQANVDYVRKHNPEIDPAAVEVCPNSVKVEDMRVGQAEREKIRKKYGLPLDKKIFVYGGNLGRPQGIAFLMECLKAEADHDGVYFLIVGDGTEFGRLELFLEEVKPKNVKSMKHLPKEEYDRMIAACDVGMIFLDHRFTIPNFPSRILAYMQAALPVLACTDVNTDIGDVITRSGFGWWCESNDVKAFQKKIHEALCSDLEYLGNRGYEYLAENYTVERAYDIIMK